MPTPTTELMDDYGAQQFARPVTQEESPQNPTPEPEFDPNKDIDALSNKYFSELNANTNIPEAAKLRLAHGFLANEGAIKAQRAKLEADKQASLINNLRAQQLEGTIKESRMKLEQTKNSMQRQSMLSEQVKGVMFNPELSPDQKRNYVNSLEIDNNAFVSSDPTAKNLFDNARGMLPKQRFPEEMSDTVKSQLGETLANARTAEEFKEIQMLDSPQAISFYSQRQKILKDLEAKDEAKREVARKEERSLVLELVKKDTRFMTEEERDEAGVDPKDKNPYLTPESQATFQNAIVMVGGAKGLEEYLAEKDDKVRFGMGQKAMNQVLIKQFDRQENPKAAASSDKAKSLVP